MQREETAPTGTVPEEAATALLDAGWLPGRRNMHQAEHWADRLAAHTSADGYRHSLFAAAVEAWAEYGGVHVTLTGPGIEVARTPFVIDPLLGLHLPRTLTDLGRALGTQLAPLGAELVPDAGTGPDAVRAHLAIDASGAVHSLDHTGDWFLGDTTHQALAALICGTRPHRLPTSG
ncbi:SUKH-3 domain-containing protein [Allostreptomyces psammosilenae]|nr:SUKH-3 domain-containing protein [Allostreptomyces psammosilenae]